MAQRNAALPLVIAIALAVLGAGVGYFLMAAEPAPVVVIEQRVPPVEAIPPSAPPSANEVEQPISPQPEPSATTPEPSTAPRNRNRMARDLKREQIWSALDRAHDLQPAAPGSAAPVEQDAERLPQLDPEYIRTAITEQLLPIVRECYDSALEDDPKLEGKLEVEFTIIGAEDIGSVVEDATIDETSTLDSEFVRECVRESLMTVTFEPPPDGGRLVVSFPVRFAPDE